VRLKRIQRQTESFQEGHQRAPDARKPGRMTGRTYNDTNLPQSFEWRNTQLSFSLVCLQRKDPCL